MAILDLNNLTNEQAVRLNEISRNIKDDFNRLTESILQSSDKSLAWFLHPLASRNMYLSSLFIDLSRLLLAKERIDSNHDLSKIIVTSSFQKKIIEEYTGSSGSIVIESPSAYKIKSFKKSTLYHLFKIGYKSIMMLLSKDRSRNRLMEKSSPITILDTFLTNQSLNEGRYIDRYYNGLLDHVSNDEASSIYWLPTIISRFNVDQLKLIHESSKENILFKQDYLKWKDYFWAIYQLFKQKKPDIENLSFHQLNISDLVFREFRSGKITNSAFEGLINYRFIKRLKEAGARLQLVIDWNENQPIDRGLIKGVREYYPETKIKGYQGYIISTDYNFYISPTDYEVDSGIIPDKICVVGNKFKDLITQFSDKVEVEAGPAFRFDYLLGNSNSAQMVNSGDRRKTVLILLPIGIREINNILENIYHALNNWENDIDFEILVKPHPLVSKDKIRDNNYWLTDYSIIEGNFSEVIKTVDLLIGNSSSALVESVINGVPVIIVGSSEQITQNPIPPFINKDFWRIVYDGQSTKDTILEFLSITQIQHQAFIKEMESHKRDYIEAVNDESVKHFLEL